MGIAVVGAEDVGASLGAIVGPSVVGDDVIGDDVVGDDVGNFVGDNVGVVGECVVGVSVGVAVVGDAVVGEKVGIVGAWVGEDVGVVEVADAKARKNINKSAMGAQDSVSC